MFISKKIQFLFLTLLASSFCDDLESEDLSIECLDDDTISNENGTEERLSYFSKNVKFYLLTPDNDTIALNSTNLDLLNNTNPTKIMIHGLGAYEDHVWIDTMAHNYHTKGNYNVIAVDWSVVSTKDRFYVISVVDSVGEVVGNFLLKASVQNVEMFSTAHLIGSSIGAHVGGAAGKTVSKNGKKIDRITGLDPTEPEELDILDESDAEFVDVIHTTTELGQKSCGTVDFYLTADKPDKPICVNDSCGTLLGEDFFAMTIVDEGRFEGVSCHNSTAYIQNLCDKANNAVMGEYVWRNATGNYLVAKDSANGIYSQGKYLLLIATLVWFLSA